MVVDQFTSGVLILCLPHLSAILQCAGDHLTLVDKRSSFLVVID